jgi:hypothetical protein
MWSTVKVFLWWFIIGATMALAVIMLQGGIREAMQTSGSVWGLKLFELLTTILGGGAAWWLYRIDSGSHQEVIRAFHIVGI